MITLVLNLWRRRKRTGTGGGGEDGFLLTEDSGFLLQEDGSKIKI